MKDYKYKLWKSRGSGKFNRKQFRRIGKNVIFEFGCLVFHPENIEIGDNVYVGHYAILHGYYNNIMVIGDDTWIGHNCFFHSGGGLFIGNGCGIGPHVKILTQQHRPQAVDIPLTFCKQESKKVVINDFCNIGVGTIILPGATIGQSSLIGAGAVVTKNIRPRVVAVGVPARVLHPIRFKKEPKK